VILTNPDAPTSLANNAAVTTATQIGLTWSAGAENGGAPVIDYRLTFDQGTGTWVTYASGIQTTQITVMSLSPGNTYAFRVEARNSYAYSALSAVISQLAA
jgi:hypothetical protein